MRMPLFYTASAMVAGTYGLTFLFPSLFINIGGNEADVGNAFAVIAISTLLALLVSGHITATLGHMLTIALSSALLGGSLVAFSFIDEINAISYLAAAILGGSYGLFYTLTPIVIAQNTPIDQRIQSFTFFSVFIMLGLGLSPALNYALEAQGFPIQASFLTVGLMCFASSLIYYGQKNIFAFTTDNEQRLSLPDIRQVFASKARTPIVMIVLGTSVFAGITNFQVTYAIEQNLSYVDYFLAYTAVVVIFRLFFSTITDRFQPHVTITALLTIMALSVFVFLNADGNRAMYLTASLLFGIGYGVSYPVVKAVASLKAEPHLFAQTMQIFGFAYFVGVFGFPFVAGWIVHLSDMKTLLIVVAALAITEALLATRVK